MFNKMMLSEEVRKQYAETEYYYAEKRKEAEDLTDASLLSTIKYYLSNMQAPRKHKPEEPVYDSTFWYTLLPELLKRFREKTKE